MRSTNLQVKDIMRTEVKCLYIPGDRDEALELFKKYNLKLIPVLKKGTKKLIGVITHRELIEKPDEEDLAILVNRNPKTIQQDAPISEALKLITEDKTRILVVLDGDEMVGLLTVHIIVKNILANKDFDEPIKPYITTGIASIWDGTPLPIAQYIMQIAETTVIPCIDDTGSLSGIISYDELMKESEVVMEEDATSMAATEDYDWSWETADTLIIAKKSLKLPNKLVRDVMIKKGQLQTVYEVTPIKECAIKMRKYSLDQLPVLDVHDKFIGMIYDIDLIKVLLKEQ